MASTAQIQTASPRPATTWVAPWPEWLVLSLLIAASLPPILFHPHSLPVVAAFNLLDGSWPLDGAYKALSGLWFGRDVLFTYGPLYQWLSSMPAHWLGVSTGTIFATCNTLPNLLAILAIFVATRILLPKVEPWKRAVFLCVVLWTPPGIRLAVCLLAFSAFLWLADAVASRPAGTPISAILAAALCYVAFLVSADAGLYAFVALFLVTGATAFFSGARFRTTAALCKFLLLTACCEAVLMIATNAVMFSPLNFSYWKSSLTLVSSYRWFEPKAITTSSTYRILAVLIFSAAVFGAGYWRRKQNGGRWTSRPVFLLSGFFLGLTMLQSGLVRSDAIHVANGIYPLVFLSGVILVGARPQSRIVSVALPAIVIATAPLIATPYAEPLPVTLAHLVQAVVHPTTTCPAGTKQFDGACFAPQDAELFATVSRYIDDHTQPAEPVLVFPYQNAFGVMSRRTVAGGVLQGYLVNGQELTGLHLARLQSNWPSFGVYFPEADASLGLAPREGMYSYSMDGVPSFTRSPQLWFELLRHYRSQGSPAPGVVGLVRDDSRPQRLVFAEEPIAAPPGTIKITKPNTWLDVSPIQWPAGSDFVKLRLRINYKFWWKLRKPSSLSILIHFSDQSWQLAYFVVPPNQDSEVWIYPGQANTMANYFSSYSTEWPKPRVPSRISLLIEPFDWFSVTPESVELKAMDSVRISLQ